MLRKALIALLFLLAIASAALWVDSYRVRTIPTSDLREYASWWSMPQRLKALYSVGSLGSSGRGKLERRGAICKRSVGDQWTVVCANGSGVLLFGYSQPTDAGVTVRPIDRHFWGFGYSRSEWPALDVSSGTWGSEGDTAWRAHMVAVPFWCVVLVFGAHPLVAFVRGPLRRTRHRRMGCCVQCGYLLVGLSGAQCPECGHGFDPTIAQHSLYRWDRSAKRAADRLARCRASRARKLVAAVAIVGLISSIVLWVASYYRVAWRGSAFSCRAAWGNVILYYGGPLGASTASETTTARGFSKVGFQGWSTMWWPRPFLKRGHGPALYVPLWLSSLLFLTAALISYRPLLRLRCRRALRIAEARAGPRLPPVGGSG